MRSTACLLLLLTLCASAHARLYPDRLMGHHGEGPVQPCAFAVGLLPEAAAAAANRMQLLNRAARAPAGNNEHPTMLRRALLQLDDILGYVKQGLSGSGQQGGTRYQQQPRQEQQGGSWQPGGQQGYWQGYQPSSGAGSTVVVQQGGSQQQAQAWAASSYPSSMSGSPSSYQTYYPSNPSSGPSNGGGGWSSNPQGGGSYQPQQQAPSGSSSGQSSAPNSGEPCWTLWCICCVLAGSCRLAWTGPGLR